IEKLVSRHFQKDKNQACLRPRDRFWDIPVPKIDSAFDNLFVPQPSWSPSTTQQLRKLVAASYLPPNDWTPRSEAYFVFPLAQGTPGKQCGLTATGVYQPSLRFPWLAASGSGITIGCQALPGLLLVQPRCMFCGQAGKKIFTRFTRLKGKLQPQIRPFVETPGRFHQIAEDTLEKWR
ncbi:hypothetical protein, partial [Thiolapillus sp.]|uniref:hypothetical protein n=1 Tax=Thiolapillus sp. TaxID=2017437 RepID=UPI003AF60F37